MRKKLLSLLVLLAAVATGAWAQPWTSGDCTVTLTDDGVLIVSGTGAMADYTKVTEQPWASNRNSITSIVVGEGVTHIGNFALAGCTKATSVSLPSSLTSIGTSAFRACNNAGFTSIAIPANVETIGDNAFHTCNKLTQVNIPDKVTSIGQNAFYGCTAVTSITVGKSVTSIGEMAFRNCSAMTTLAVKAPACALGTNALDACSSLTTIYVTTDKADYYKTADGWSAYAAKIQAGYDISLKEGTEDAYKWAIMPGLAAEGDKVTLQYNGRLKVKSVKAKKKAAAGPTYNETKSINDGPVTVAAGEHWLITGTGTQTSNAMSIGAGATVTLDGVNISSSGYCIKCAGDATIILKDGSTNTLTSTGDALLPALSIGDANTTLTIQGSTGVLNVESGDYCAGIGGGYSNTNSTCGNIRIEGGVITVQGGYGGAGIGTDAGTATCGDIIITGGTITANGGGRAAGIGTGTSDYGNTVCGNITIANTVTKVTATAGNQAPYSIGKGYGGSASCGTVTIGGVVGAITDSPFTYPVPAVPTLADVFTDGAVVGVAVKNTYDTYTVTGTYSGGSYTSYTKSSNDIEEVTMTKDGNNLVVWIKSVMNSECTLTFNTQDNTYTKSFKAGTGAPVWNLSEFVSITVNGTDITSTLEDVTPAAAETTVTWDFSQLSGTAGTGYENGGVKLEACEGEISFDYNQLNAWGNGITITNTLGKKFTSIVINGTEYGVGIFGGGWSNADDNSSATWTGNSESVYIEGSSMASGITSIVFTLEDAPAPALLQVTVHESEYSPGSGDHTIYYASGETWAEAITNHPTENADWSVSNNFVYYNAYQVYDGSAAVMADNPIENAYYEF